jgi:hypothetical protein
MSFFNGDNSRRAGAYRVPGAFKPRRGDGSLQFFIKDDVHKTNRSMALESFCQVCRRAADIWHELHITRALH